MEGEDPHLEEFVKFVIGSEEVAKPLPNPLEVLAEMGVEIEVDEPFPPILRVGYFDGVSHVGPLQYCHLSLTYDMAHNRRESNSIIEYVGGVLCFRLPFNQLIAIHPASGSMPRNKYQKVNLSDYNRKLAELEERRTSGAGPEL